MKLTKKQKADFAEYLSEGMHTAFRKGSDHPSAIAIHGLIRKMPDDEWASVVEFVSIGMVGWMETRLAGKE